MSRSKRILSVSLQSVLVLGLLVGAAFVFRGLLSSRVEAVPSAPTALVPEVEVERASVVEHRPVIDVRGQVVPSREAVLRARVGGEVLWLHPAMQWGGQVKEGELLVRIEPKDYQLSVEAERIAVKQAEAQLELEDGRQTLAKRELELLQRSADDSIRALLEQSPQLATREPQLRSVRGQVESAKNRLARAKLELERTELRAPFDAMVRAEAIELGELVNPQSQLATLVATDAYWVAVSIPLDRLHLLSFAESHSATLPPSSESSPVRVLFDDGREERVWQGRLLRLLGEVEASGRMARALVEVPAPLEAELPLLLGVSVRVELEGRPLRGVKVPNVALMQGERLLVLEDDSTVSEREVEVVWRDSEMTLLGSGVEDGEKVVMTRLAVVQDGMQVALSPAREAETTRVAVETPELSPAQTVPALHDGETVMDENDTTTAAIVGSPDKKESLQ